MADKSFGVKELNLLNASGTPTVTSPNNLNLNANTVAISTSCTIGNNLTVTSTTNSANLNVSGIGTLTRAFATDLSVSGVSTITVPANANPHSSWDVVNNGSSAYRFTGPGQDGAEDNPNIYLVRGQRYVFKMNASGHPFQIRVANAGAAYSDGVTNNGSQTGNVVFNVQHDAPAQLFYQCTSHGSMVGNIYIVGGPQVISGVVTATSFVGDGSNLTGITSPAITSIGSDGAGRVLTSDGDGTATAHSFVTIESSRLSVNRGSGSGAFPLIVRRTDASGIIAEFSNSSGYGIYLGQNSATGEAYIRTATGQPLVFTTNAGSGIANERLRITSGGHLVTGAATPPNQAANDGSLFLKNDATLGFLSEGGSLTFNAYYNGGWKYYTSGDAHILWGSGNGINLSMAGAGTANNAVSFSRAFQVTTTKAFHFGSQTSLGKYADNVQGCSWYDEKNSWQQGQNGSIGWSMMYFNKIGGSDNRIMQFNSSGSNIGYINRNGGNTQFATSSDYRLKKDIVALPNGLERVKQLRPVAFKWIADNSDMEGFVAHEAQEVCPYAVTGTKDEVATEDLGDRKKGDMIVQAVDYGEFTPLLTAAMKELIVKVETLEQENKTVQELITKVETLEQDNIALRARVTNLEGN